MRKPDDVATDLNKAGGKVLDSAGRGPPESLDDLLRDYDPAKINALVSEFLDRPPAGKEII